jgi:hypothetical protein
MNSKLAEVGKPTPWPPGQSGNPAGKPPGTSRRHGCGLGLSSTDVWLDRLTVSAVVPFENRPWSLLIRHIIMSFGHGEGLAELSVHLLRLTPRWGGTL